MNELINDEGDTGQYLMESWYWGAFTTELILGSISWRADTGSISEELILGGIFWRAGTGEHVPES